MRMPKSPVVTVRNCNILIAVMCIVISSTTCTFLATWSGDKAVQKATDTGMQGVSMCFAAADTTAVILANGIISQVTQQVMSYADNFAVTPVRALQTITAFMAAQPAHLLLDWGWQTKSLAPLMWSSLQLTLPDGVWAMGHANGKGQFRMVYEADDTIGPPYRDDWTAWQGPEHEIQLIGNDGVGFEPNCGENNSCRTMMGRAQPYTGSWSDEPCEDNRSLGEGRGFTSAPCPWENFDPLSGFAGKYWNLGKLFVKASQNVSRPWWSPIIPISTVSGYFLLSGYSPASHGSADPGLVHSLMRAGHEKLGITFAMVEISRISDFFRTVAQAAGSAGVGMRVYAVDSVPPAEIAESQLLAGVSHGAGVEYRPQNDDARGRVAIASFPLKDIHASDYAIRSVAEWAAEHGYDALSDASAPTQITAKGRCLDDPIGELAGIRTGCAITAFECDRTGFYCCDYDMGLGAPILEPSQLPYQISQRFHPPGIFPNRTVRDMCPLSCGGCSEVESKELLVRAQRYTNGFGLKWWVVIALSRADIMGQIEVTDAITRASIARSNEEINAEREEDRSVVLLSVSGLGVLLCVLSVVFAHIVTLPLERLGAEMSRVACMQLEGVETEVGLSALGEVRRMQQSFHEMVACIKRYREFLPHSVLQIYEEVSVPDTDSDSDSDVITIPTPGSNADTEGRRASLGRASLASLKGDKGERERSDPMSDESRSALEKVSHKLREGLDKKRLSFVATGNRSWTAAAEALPESLLLLIHSNTLSQIVLTSNIWKGVVDGFAGDRALISFNAVRNCATHRATSVRAALSLLHACDRWQEAPHEIFEVATPRSRDPSVPVSPTLAPKDFRPPELALGVSSAEARVGNMGCEGLRKFSFVSLGVTFVSGIERVACALGVGCLCDKLIHSEAEATFEFRWVGEVVMPKRGLDAVPTYQLGREKHVDNDEWMYQLETLASQVNEYSHWRAAIEAVKSLDWGEAAHKVLLLTPDKGADRRTCRAFALLNEWIAARSLPAPHALRFT
eukprot:Hpha_TRINITY_DN16512_c3_g2::TRINITY_DN16512_c3_g2_i1::g.134778::m.134778